ncbi:MAG: substrate-binding domain-containing protein [Nostoc sp.]|uniref:substrate-binding domain-containing protein n=1 Tax=Nostoc sp. TaxID=1180 RepID=UPI002FF76F80
MKLDINLYNNLKSIRTRLGMSQQDLANIAGVTRQSIGGVESGQYAPSVAMSLRLAKALGCQVEDLFWFEQNLPEVEAVLNKSVQCGQQLRVSLARVGGRWIAYPLVGNDAFRLEMIPADGEAVAVSHQFTEKNSDSEAKSSFFPRGDAKSDRVALASPRASQALEDFSADDLFLYSPLGEQKVSQPVSNPQEHLPCQKSYVQQQTSQQRAAPYKIETAVSVSKLPLAEDEAQNQTSTNKVLVRLLDDVERLQNTVVVAGCTPMISLWARASERWHPKLRVHHILANSMAALRSLCQGEVHIAGMHLYDPETGEHNIPFVRKALAGRSAVLIALGVWEEGLLVAPGNPKGIKTVSDLVELGATVVNRELGSSCRILLERKLQEKQISLHTVKGFDHIVYNHQDVALSVISGIADVGVSTASVAAAFGLGFISLHRSRYDLVILKEYLEEIPVQQLLSTLGHRLVQSQLEILGGYDVSNIGEVVANI